MFSTKNIIGKGIGKGMLVTLKHFVSTYVEDFRYYFNERGSRPILDYRMDPHTDGFYTMQYPEEKPKIPESFRFLPFLVTDHEGDDAEKRRAENRCTSCGICAKACPPQCIWIVRTTDSSGKPVPQPHAFFIDTDICMNCGYCAEFCPFDAIIMDHEYALADYAREGETNHIHDLDYLMKPASYYKSIRPNQYVRMEQQRIADEEEKKRKAAAKAKKMAERKAKAAAKKSAEKPTDASDEKKPAQAKRSPEERKAQREAMMAKKKAKQAAQAGGDEAAGKPAVTDKPAATDKPAKEASQKPAQAKRSPEEIQAQREAMMVKRRARNAGETKDEDS